MLFSHSREEYDVWVKVSYKKADGWVNLEGVWWDPYDFYNLEYIGSIESDSKTWTIRKYDEYFRIGLYRNTKIDVRDKPGSDGNIVAVLEEKKAIILENLMLQQLQKMKKIIIQVSG